MLSFSMKYWVDQKVCLVFAIRSYGKTQMNFSGQPNKHLCFHSWELYMPHMLFHQQLSSFSLLSLCSLLTLYLKNKTNICQAPGLEVEINTWLGVQSFGLYTSCIFLQKYNSGYFTSMNLNDLIYKMGIAHKVLWRLKMSLKLMWTL